MIVKAWNEGWRRMAAAPAIAAGVFALTFALALPMAIAMRDLLRTHLGRSLEASSAADHVNYDWWLEFLSQTSGLGSTFSPAIIGFSATLDNISGLLDSQAEAAPVLGALALYLAGWTFLTGGILDRYARQRRTRAHGFFAACGVHFFRFARLGVIAGVFYWWLFDFVHPWLFDVWYPRLTRDISVERQAFAVRLALYAGFGVLLIAGNLAFDYARIRTVVEDRRSVVGALSAALRFIGSNTGRTFGLYLVNGATFAGLLASWSLVAPGAGGAGLSIWTGLLAGQLYLLARLLLKLQFLASQTSLFQARLAHAAYTGAPERVWPESPAAETIAGGGQL